MVGGFAFLSVSAQATVSEGFFNYLVTNGEAEITAYEGPRNTNVTVPESLGGFPVRRVSNAFKRLGILGVNLPSTLRTLDVDAFASCANLTNVVVPEGVTAIFRTAFWQNVNLTEVVLPESLQVLTDGNFTGCRSLLSIRIPPLVKNLEKQRYGPEAEGDQVLKKEKSHENHPLRPHPDVRPVGRTHPPSGGKMGRE